MALISIFEMINFDCFFGGNKSRKKTKKKKTEEMDDEVLKVIHDISERYDISVLPVNADFELDNLYPETNQVHKWNIIVIGKDKTFIHCHIYDLNIPEHETFTNHKSASVLDRALQELFDPMFDKTLQGHKLQFFIGWNGQIYLVNTYPITNKTCNIIGAVLFIRNYKLMPRLILNSGSFEQFKC
jgi:hypothetical protein